MANRRHGFGGGGRSYYNSGPVNPWQVGNAPANQGGGHFNGNPPNLLSQLSEPQAQLALAISKLLQPQQQVPSLLTMNTVNPLQNSGYGPNYMQRGPRGNNMNRRPRPDMKPYNKMNNRNNRDTDRRRANSNKKSQPQQRNTVVSKSKKPSSTKASSKSPGKTTEVKKTSTVKEEKDGKSTTDTTESAVKETDDKSEDVESGDKKRDWKEEKNENEESSEKTSIKIEPSDEPETASTETETEKAEKSSKESKSGAKRFDGIPKELLYCNICQKKMWDSESFAKHLNGRAHIQMFEKVEESYLVKANMMRETIRLSEAKNNIEMDRMKRLGKKTKTQQLSRCAMCDLDFYGQLFVHRKSPNHQKLKHFLHPRCSYCNKEFPTRMEWENHRHSVEHLRKKADKKKKSGSTEAETDDEGILIEDEFFIVLDSTESDEHEDPNAVIDLTDDVSSNSEIQLPVYKPNRAVGTSLIAPTSGFLCKGCNKFFPTEKASQQHTQSKSHFEVFINLLNEKVVENEEKKRKADEEEEEGDDEGNWKRRKTSKEDEEDKDEEKDESKVDESMEVDDKDKTENGEEFYDPSETFNTTDPNDIDLESSKECSVLVDDVWSEVDNKIDEIIEEVKESPEKKPEKKADPQPVPPPAKSAKSSRPQRAIRGRRT